MRHPYSLAYALYANAWTHLCRREGRRAWEQAAATVQLATEQGFPYWVGMGESLQGAARVVQACSADGVGHLLRGLEALRATGATLWRTCYLIWLILDSRVLCDQ